MTNYLVQIPINWFSLIFWYDLESLLIGLDEEEPTNWWETNEYAVPDELLANKENEEKEKKPRKIRGFGTDPFIQPLRWKKLNSPKIVFKQL